MTNVVKIVAVYMDYPHYMKPKEINKVFKLYRKYMVTTDKNETASVKGELIMLLDVLTAKEDRTYRLRSWNDINTDTEVAILEILDPVTSSLFETEQDKLT